MREPFTILQLPKHCNEILILSVLNRGNKHGYELALGIEEISNGYFKFNHGTLYPILHKLEKEGLIRGRWKQEGPKRKRKIYAITGKGRKYHADLAREWKQFQQELLAIIGGAGQ